MSKEKFFHRVPKTSKEVLRRLQSFRDRPKPEPFQAGFASVDMDHGIQYDPRTVELQRKAYPVSITHLEDPRLKDD